MFNKISDSDSDSEKIRILAWRQENEIMKISADILRGQGHMC